MKKPYLIINALVFEVIYEDSPVKAWAEFVTKSTDVTKDIVFWEKEDLRVWLVKNGYKTLTPTSFSANVFEINK